jgi:hypothetical protein
MTAHGLPNEKATTLDNLALNNGPTDGVSQTATSPPTSVLVTLAAAGRNPTDILIPTQAGTDGDSGIGILVAKGGSASGGETSSPLAGGPPADGSHLVAGTQAPGVIGGAVFATPWADAEAPLGEGDLVIITAGSPATEERKVEQHTEGMQRGATFDDFKKAQPTGKFALSETRPATLEELAIAIHNAERDNGGKKFKRIIILSHAGGPDASPSIQLGGGPKLQAGGNIPDSLKNEVDNALEPTGILIFGSCGYYYEEIIVKRFIVDGKTITTEDFRRRDPAKIPADKAYQLAWIVRLTALAGAFGHAVYADPSRSWPSARPEDAGSVRRTLDSKPQSVPKGTIPQGPVPYVNEKRIGIGPDGRRLTNR